MIVVILEKLIVCFLDNTVFKISYAVKTIFGGNRMRNFFTNNMNFRIIMSLVSLLTLMFFCVVRICEVSSLSYETAGISNGYTIEIKEGRGNFFDCNGERITGEQEFYYVVFLPCDEAILRFAVETDGSELEDGLKSLRSKKPVLIKSENKISGVGIYSFKSTERYSEDLGLEHIVGYLDGEGNGVAGLEKSYNELIKADSNTELFFETSASGEFLLGSQPQVKKSYPRGDVYLTIDKNIQKICNNAAKSIKMGAVVVTEISSGKIRGMISKPEFNVNNLKASVNDSNSPFLNRVLNAYSVGSVFKPLIAAAMLETSNQSYNYNCSGYTDILGIRFFCNNHNGHGNMDLNTAIINSCNTYFYNAAAKVSPKALIEISNVLGFGKNVKLTDDINAVAGSFTTLAELEKSKANVANFAIGQGNIALSPLVMTNLYSAIANEGYYFSPQLIEGYSENGEYYKTQQKSKNVVFSKQTADILKQYLINAVELGTGKNAKTEEYGVGGKTATAQTGRYSDSKEILNAWFCGFFPSKNPKYVVVILAEQANSGSSDCAPVFKKIAEEINNLK